MLQTSVSRVFTDDKVSGAVLDMIRNAEGELVLVSPYNNFWDHLKNELIRATRRGVKITAIYRSKEDNTDMTWLGDLGALVYSVDKLHSKIYMNDSSILVGSMNLLESSSKNSRELAVSIENERDQLEIKKYVHQIMELGTQEFPKAPRSPRSSTTPKVVRNTTRKESDSLTKSVSKVWNSLVTAVSGGSCIRCSEHLQYDIEKPLCATCYKAWSRYKRPDFEEKYCHRCGKKSSTSLAKPLCRVCYQAPH